MPGSRNRAETRGQLARLYARLADIRRDALHPLTAQLAGHYGTVVVARLPVAGMLLNRRRMRAVADAALAETCRQLAYKTAWHGFRLVGAEPFYPSSLRCTGGGAVKDALPLRERTGRCDACGLFLDRDENAERSLAVLAAAVAESGLETASACG
jgi:putative transposase